MYLSGIYIILFIRVLKLGCKRVYLFNLRNPILGNFLCPFLILLYHIDEIFYYLINMPFHHLPSIVECVTTTDILFDQRMKNSYDKFLSHRLWSTILCCYLGFFDGLGLMKKTHAEIKFSDPIEIIFVIDLPTQEKGDCGIFVLHLRSIS
ncbi:eukaryotic translation initiation factor 3subunit D-2 [Striga asiatica]|uniref:Eukaryotic translation initiation factor 3subunit D-2 n=1 Tax=Striga asiatica TaxID=4170 RepID=A0A5A7PKU6_STRAF|nr:eukaryotic translation initiation factor 3subunit D-2 [Striga asiatica]